MECGRLTGLWGDIFHSSQIHRLCSGFFQVVIFSLIEDHKRQVLPQNCVNGVQKHLQNPNNALASWMLRMLKEK